MFVHHYQNLSYYRKPCCYLHSQSSQLPLNLINYHIVSFMRSYYQIFLQILDYYFPLLHLQVLFHFRFGQIGFIQDLKYLYDAHHLIQTLGLALLQAIDYFYLPNYLVFIVLNLESYYHLILTIFLQIRYLNDFFRYIKFIIYLIKYHSYELFH